MGLARDCTAILPFNLALDDIKLIYATAQPLTLLETGEAKDYFFFGAARHDCRICIRRFRGD